MKRVCKCAALAALSSIAFNTLPVCAETSETHKVLKGDTLWDLSNSYLKDPLLWPKIWKINPDIQNPHMISPGQVVKIPLLDGKPSTEAPAEAGGSMLARPVAPPPAPEPVVAEPTPEPVPEEVAKPAYDLSAPPLALRIDEEKPKVSAEQQAMVADGIGAQYYDRGIGIVTEIIPTDGQVLETEESWMKAAVGNTIYIKAPYAKVGQQFGIYRDLGNVKFPDTLWTKSSGHLLADVAVVEVVSIDKGKQLAKVKRAFTEVHKGDLLGPVAEVPVVTPRSRENAPVPIKGNVIAMHLGRSLAGPDDIVYINLGSTNGIVPGDRLFLAGPKEKMVQRDAGEVMVLRVTPTTAAVVVLPNSSHSVHVGDQVGPLL